MVDIVIKVLEPATEFAFLTLEEAKIYLGISSADTSNDELLQMQININSATIAELCNRTFAYEKVQETWRCVGAVCCPDGMCRIHLTHWPVIEMDIESVESPIGNTILPSEYELEEASGKLLLLNGCVNEIAVVYSGGYDLPDEAPLPLKQATGLLVRASQSEAEQISMANVRMISHKNARIMFQPPAKTGSSTTASAGNAAMNNIKGLLSSYQRFWV